MLTNAFATFREAAGLSRRDVALMAGVAYNQVAAVESFGPTRVPERLLAVVRRLRGDAYAEELQSTYDSQRTALGQRLMGEVSA